LTIFYIRFHNRKIYTPQHSRRSTVNVEDGSTEYMLLCACASRRLTFQ